MIVYRVGDYVKVREGDHWYTGMVLHNAGVLDLVWVIFPRSGQRASYHHYQQKDVRKIEASIIFEES